MPTLPPSFTGHNTTSEIAVGRSGRVVYGSNRGHDSIAVFAVDETSGVLTPVGWEPSQGKTPRCFALDPAGLFLYAANQGSDTMPRLGRRGPSPATGLRRGPPCQPPREAGSLGRRHARPRARVTGGAFATVSATAGSWTTETIPIAGVAMQVARAGGGPPLLVLHHDIGTLERLPFYDTLATRFTVVVPSHLGYDGSQRPDWMRNVRDLAAAHQWLLSELAVTRDPQTVSVVGLGFGGWIAAEMATQAPRAFRKLVLVGAMGLKPDRGVIADQALLSYIDYVRLGFADQRAFDRLFGADPTTAQLEKWDLNREMTFRIAWKPYMYNPTLPHLLGGVPTPTLVVWGRDDRVVPLECGERFAKALPRARLEVVEGAGHFVEMEKPHELAQLVTDFVSQGES